MSAEENHLLPRSRPRRPRPRLAHPPRSLEIPSVCRPRARARRTRIS